MNQQTIVVPDGRLETILEPEISYTVPEAVWVVDAETKQVLNLQQISVKEALKVILIPKVRGG